jgi:hypothetical protein
MYLNVEVRIKRGKGSGRKVGKKVRDLTDLGAEFEIRKNL